MLHVHRSESGDALVEALAGLLEQPLGDPFAPEVVAVPARGIERWLAQRLSHRLGAGASGDGVCAHVRFPRPDEMLDDAIAAASADRAASVQAWHADAVVWPLLEVLDACPPGEEWCAGLRRHLGSDEAAPSTRRLAVAQRLAGLYASYGAARPSLLQAWARGVDTGVADDLRWQPELWRRLRDRLASPAPAELLDDACTALRARPEQVDLPDRLGLYGVSRLDTARLQVLTALAEHRDVHLWLNSASPALWESVGRVRPVPPRRVEAQQAVRARHPLLASLSRDVRELQLRLATAAPGHADTHHPAAAAPSGTLLRRLQDDLRHDRVSATKHVLDPVDRSVQVHACHGRARQVEVLREVVLGLLRDDPSLEPRDLLVMCPDVESYAPLVAAAFGTDTHPGGRLRVTLADRSPRQSNPLLGVAADVLELAASRVTGTEVLDLAGSPPVRLRFGFDDDAVEQLRAWTVRAGVRWGLTAGHREPWRMQGLHQGTWREGLDRLLAGVALEESDDLFGGILPMDEVDSVDVALAGRFAELLDRLDVALGRLGGEQPVDAWLDALQESVLTLADVPADGAWQLAQLRREFGEVRAAADGATVPLGLADVTALLGRRLAGRPTTTGFRTGGLTVCTLTPMRSVPHRVVCLLGLDDGAFPRSTVPHGDDLLARDPHLGDRDPRSEDRQLFLDALCAAREHLVVTYAGADARTGAQLPPAVPLGELLDALDATARTRDGRPAREHVVVRHPLQPFDARNFTPGALGRPDPLSFDTAALAGARAAAGVREDEPPFLGVPLPPLPTGDGAGDGAVVELARLVEFWQHPARGFLRQRLGVSTGSREEEPDDALPVELDGLAQWKVGDRALQARLREVAPPRILAVEAARGELPPQPLGGPVLSKIGHRVDALVAAAGPFLAEDAGTVDVEAELPGGGRLTGGVPGVRGDVVLTVTYSTPRAKHRMRAWVELLALTAARPDRPWRAVLVGRDRDAAKVAVLGSVAADAARAALADLVALRDMGLRVPLPLPVQTTEAYAGAGIGARSAAYAAWASRYGYEGEDAEPEHVLVWGERMPVEALLGWVPPPDLGDPARLTFPELARRVWAPLLAAEGTP